ncbi:MAG TPA: response regulator, partial [Verrucomicrobiae bacterium]|nr:response regulator [Verrucomicrobiae bacterium]
MNHSHEKKQARRALRVLVIEDCEADAVLLLRALQKGGFEPRPLRVADPLSLRQALHTGQWDLILADHSMPDFSARDALELVKKQGLDVPFIIVSGHIEETTAVAAMRAGAHDYVMKDRLARLVPAVERELREAEVRRARLLFETQLQEARQELEIRVERRTADLRAANEQLHRLIEDRRRLENELLEIAENERRRIGFDLHDDVGQKLAGVALMLKSVERRLAAAGNAAAADITRIQSLIEEVTQHTHNLAHDFSSLDHRSGDIIEALNGLAGKVKKMFDGVRCSFEVNGKIQPMPEHSVTQLYKIAQEAISNSIKHGRSKRVWITLSGSEEKLVLTIKNDGLPFSPPSGPTRRMGLRIMNYRASTIGGTMQIQPVGRSGTLVTCEVPWKSEAKAARAAFPASSATGASPLSGVGISSTLTRSNGAGKP